MIRILLSGCGLRVKPVETSKPPKNGILNERNEARQPVSRKGRARSVNA